MSERDDDVSEWMRAGGDALLINVPMSPNRFEDLAAYTADHAGGTVVDFGCGRGAFAHRVAELSPALAVHGVDTSEEAIAHASHEASRAALLGLTFETADANSWAGAVDTAACMGSSHAFGDSAAMFARLHELGASRAVIGDGFWETEPDAWCLENLGDMERSVAAVAGQATGAGWLVDAVDVSTIEEWDAFEHHWGAGVRSLGTQGALAFADERAEEYTRYRGALGFAWMQLRRA